MGSPFGPAALPVGCELEGLRDGSLKAALLRERSHLPRREFTAARAILEEARSRYPLALPPRVLLCRGLLQENRDRTGTEKVPGQAVS